MNKKTIATGVVVALIALIVFSIYLWNKEVDKDNEELAVHQQEKAEQEKKEKEERDEEIATYSELAQRLYHEDVSKIKLIGDSITSGVGIESHYVPEDGNIIFENEDEVYREPVLTAKSWANHFRNYTHNNFDDIDFINSGIGGKDSIWANENKEEWLSDEEDVVFVMLGTNDRSHGDLNVLENNLTDFLEFVEDNSNTMVVMSPPPALTDSEYDFGAEEINEVVENIADDNGYTFISHYDQFVNYVDENDVEITDLIHPDGTHPIDEGYQLMWNIIESELELDQIVE